MIDQAAIQIKGEASAQLADAVAQFLASGGTIQEAPPPEYRPKPAIFCQSAPVIRTTKEQMARRRGDADKKAALLEQVREAAKTMYVSQAAEHLGMGRWALGRLADNAGIQFQRAPVVVDRSNDADDVERVKAAIAIGLSRTAVSRKMGIKKCRLDRLCSEYSIDFPKQGPFGK